MDSELKHRQNIRYAWGMELEELEAIAEAQNNVCAMCHGKIESHERKRGYRPYRDKMKRLKAIVCPSCSTIIGTVRMYRKMVTEFEASWQ